MDAVAAYETGKEVVEILHVGDYDPSGEGIFRDVEETLRLYALAITNGLSVERTRQNAQVLDRIGGPGPIAFMEAMVAGCTRGSSIERETAWLNVERLALTAGQVDEYALPAHELNEADPRILDFGGAGAVEVEALPVDALLEIVEGAIRARIDPVALEAAELAEESERAIATRIAATSVAKLLEVAS